jgi:hypothetical protein
LSVFLSSGNARGQSIGFSPEETPCVLAHHLLVYLLIEEKNVCNDVESHPDEEKTPGAA